MHRSIQGTHSAIEVAKNCGIPLKIAGEVQPMFQEYFDTQVKPHVDGRFIQYAGEADLQAKNEPLENSLALLFPIERDEPFGLVMVEPMACSTPVLAVAEVVSRGVSGYVCQSLNEMADYARHVETLIRASAVRKYVEQRFTAERMPGEYVQ